MLEASGRGDRRLARHRFGSNAAYGHSRKVIGSPDGTTLQLGALLEGGADGRRGQPEWMNSLAINQGQSKSPLLDDFVKTLDTIEFKSLYLYHPSALARIDPGVLAKKDPVRRRHHFT